MARIDVVAHFFAQATRAVGVIARIAHGQQVAILGVEQEQQPIEKDQRRLANLVEVLAGVLLARELAVTDLLFARMQVALRKSAGQRGKDLAEHARAEVLRDLLFVQPGFAQRVSVKAAIRDVPGLGEKGRALEEQEEKLERVSGICCLGFSGIAGDAGHAERPCQVDLEEFFGSRTRVLPVEAPDGAVGEQTPLHRTIADDIGTAQVTQHLR